MEYVGFLVPGEVFDLELVVIRDHVRGVTRVATDGNNSKFLIYNALLMKKQVTVHGDLPHHVTAGPRTRQWLGIDILGYDIVLNGQLHTPTPFSPKTIFSSPHRHQPCLSKHPKRQ